MADGVEWIAERLDSRAWRGRSAAWDIRKAAGDSFAIVDESANIFAVVRGLLTNTFYCCIQTFRAISDNSDPHSVKIGLTTGQWRTDKAFWAS